MEFFDVQSNMLSMLHHQHRLYTAELAISHRMLSKLYKKLAGTEKGLLTWKDRGLTRKNKKKMQWDRATTKAMIKDAEAHKALLHDYVRQCNAVIASYSPQVFPGPTAGWGSSLSLVANPFAPSSTIPPTPWTAGLFEERAIRNAHGPQYWDLSMLRERQASPFTGSADSGFHEPVRGGLSTNDSGLSVDTSAIAAIDRIIESRPSRASAPSSRSSHSEKDLLPELVTPTSPVKVGAKGPSSSHKRRYSENAIQLIEDRLIIGKSSRVSSVPPFNRAASETAGSKE